MNKTPDDKKKAAAQTAATHIKDGMTLGLGTGSTAAHLVKAVGRMVQQGMSVRCIPTSEQTRQLASANGIELIEPDETTRLDLVIDGADECDGDLNLIKGGGGALLREKIVASSGARMIVIADDSKHVAQLGKFPLPVEIDRFAWPLTVQKIRQTLAEHDIKAPSLSLRPGPRDAGGGVFRSDGGNYIIDIACARIGDAAALDRALDLIPGIVETGLFIGLADIAIFGTDEGVTIIGD